MDLLSVVPVLAIVDPITILGIVSIAFSLITLGVAISQADDSPTVEEDPDTVAVRGGQLRLLIGRDIVGPYVAQSFISSRPLEDFDPLTIGKGAGPGSAALEQTTYVGQAVHVLYVGPGGRLFRILENDTVIFERDLTPANTPSGSVVNFLYPELSGGQGFNSQHAFRIFWGESDTPVDDGQLIDVPLPDGSSFNSRMSYSVRIEWIFKPLGPAPRWPRLTYDVEGPIFSQLIQSTQRANIIFRGPNFFAETPDLTIAHLSEGIRSMLLPVDDLHPGTPIPAITPGSELTISLAAYSGRDPTSVVFQAVGVSRTLPQGQILHISGRFVGPGYEILNTGTFGEVTNVRPMGPDIRPLLPGSYNEDSGIYVEVLDGFFDDTRVVELNGSDPALTSPRTGAVVRITGVNTYTVRVLDLSTAPIDTVPASIYPVRTYNFSTVDGPLASQTGFTRVLSEARETIGFNPAAVIDQLMFARFPHGAGLPRRGFSMASLESVAQGLSNENGGLRASVNLENGSQISDTVQQLLTDFGIACSLDPRSGFYVFSLVRRGDTFPVLDEELSLRPVQRAIRLSAVVRDKLSFVFEDASQSFRPTPVTRSDDGNLVEGTAPRVQQIQIETTNDPATAVNIAARREAEEFAQRDVTAVTGHKESRYLRAGTGFVFQGRRYRVMTIQRRTDSMVCDIRAVRDIFGTRANAIEVLELAESRAAPGFLGAAIVAPRESVLLPVAPLLLEASRRPNGSEEPEFIPVVGRENEDIIQTNIFASDDNATFREIARIRNHWVVATLNDAIPAETPHFLEIGAGFSYSVNISIDADRVQSLGSTPLSWQRGRQVAIFYDGVNPTEVMYLRNITAVSPGVYELDGLIRARQHTRRQSWDPNINPVTVYIGLEHQLIRISSKLLRIGAESYFKAQPVAGYGAGGLEFLESFPITPRGDSVRGLPVSQLQTTDGTNVWDGVGEVKLGWNYSNGRSLTGAGEFPAGSAAVRSEPEGIFLITVSGTTSSPDKILEAESTQPVVSLSAADLTAAGVTGDLIVVVRNAVRGLASDPVSLTVSVVP